jgi:protein-S-isoprenylcysteine O-methyltransferase
MSDLRTPRGLESETALIVFQPRPLVILYLALWGIFLVGEALLPINRRAREHRVPEDRGFPALGLIVFLVSNLIAVPLLKISPALAFATYTTSAIGLTFMLAGLVLRWWSIIHLGRLFTVDVAVTPNQPVVDSGPYKWIRHPSYTGAVMVVAGAALCFGNLASALVLLVPYVSLLMRRIQVEEAALTRGIGDRYRQYVMRTKRLVPGVY